jgi:error-prone DNA polymerase
VSGYAELHALTNFSFLRGASHPEEIVETAAGLGYAALAITDECTVSGVVRAHVAAKQYGLAKLIIGSEFRLDTGLKLVVLASNRTGYGELCSLITRGRRAADKGSYRVTANDFSAGLPNCFVLWIPDNQLLLGADDAWIMDAFRNRLWIAVELLADGL